VEDNYQIGDTKKKREQIDVVLDESQTQYQVKKFKSRNQNESNTQSWAVLGYVGQIGFMIAIPIAGGAILGKFIDEKLGMYPKMTLSFLFGGFTISIFGFVKTIQMILKRLKN
jgi:predicted F0F1-ATPase subunit